MINDKSRKVNYNAILNDNFETWNDNSLEVGDLVTVSQELDHGDYFLYEVNKGEEVDYISRKMFDRVMIS